MKFVLLLGILVLVKVNCGENNIEATNNKDTEGIERNIRDTEEELRKSRKQEETLRTKTKTIKKNTRINKKKVKRKIGKNENKERSKTRIYKSQTAKNNQKKIMKKIKIQQKLKKRLRKFRGKNNNREKSKSNKKEKKGLNKEQRQLNDCGQNLWKKAKTFTLYRTELQRAKLIDRYVKQIEKKKEAGKTTFDNASLAIQFLTSNGKKCGNDDINDEAKNANTKLQNCTKSISEICDKSTIVDLNMALVTPCIEKLESYQEAFKKCIFVPNFDCSCLDKLAPLDECGKDTFKDMFVQAKAARRTCTDRQVIGSFAYCRSQERRVHFYAKECNNCLNTITTKTPGRARELVLAELQKRNLIRNGGK